MSETDCGDSEADSRMQVDLSRNNDEETSEHDEGNNQESGLNTNYDSSDGAIPIHRYITLFFVLKKAVFFKNETLQITAKI